MFKSLVSVILPVFNGEKYILEAITSIQQQSYSNFELIIWDDGSQDSSLNICKEIAQRDPRIKIHGTQENNGLAYSMNRLIDLSQGEFIAIQEQDDISMPDRLEKEYQYLEANSEVGLVSGVAAWLDDRGEIANYFPGILYQRKQYPSQCEVMVKFLYLEQCKVVNAACMFRKSILDGKTSPFDPEARMSIDWRFFIDVAHKFKMVGLPEVLVKMRRGGNHQSVTKNKTLQFFEARRCIKKIYEIYSNDATSPINRSLYKKAMARELNLEGRYFGRWKGFGLLIKGLTYDCFDLQLWRALKELMLRGAAKFLRLRFLILI